MGTFDVGHPDAIDFIRAKREDGRLRQFNLSLLITDEFMQAVKQDHDWKLAFPVTEKEAEQDGLDLEDDSQVVWREWPEPKNYLRNARGEVACKIYRHAARPSGVGPDHGVNLRLCRAWVCTHRSR